MRLQRGAPESPLGAVTEVDRRIEPGEICAEKVSYAASYTEHLPRPHTHTPHTETSIRHCVWDPPPPWYEERRAEASDSTLHTVPWQVEKADIDSSNF